MSRARRARPAAEKPKHCELKADAMEAGDWRELAKQASRRIRAQVR